LNAHDEHVMEKYRDGGDKQRQTNTQANPKANQKAAAQKEIVATLVHGMMLPQQYVHRLSRGQNIRGSILSELYLKKADIAAGARCPWLVMAIVAR